MAQRRRPRDFGLYLHVPFCRSLCPYCHFTRTTAHDAALRRRLIKAMISELALRRARCDTLGAGRARLATVYVGGGTPSLLEPDLLSELLEKTVGRFSCVDDLELTVEANPESFTPLIAAAWRGSGVNRLSLGVQSLDDRVLRRLGRPAGANAAAGRAALELAVRTFPRVSADWILGPVVDGDRLVAELREAVASGVGHVSLYILEVHPGTPLATAVAQGNERLPPARHLARWYLRAAAALDELGLRQYEVANFARPGQESRHNRNYWRRMPYLGVGPGAHGFWGRRRVANSADPLAYCAAVERGELPVESVDHLDLWARRLESVILALRTVDGVPLDRLPDGVLPLARGVSDGLWRLADGRLRLTPRGFLQIDALEERLARAIGRPPQSPRPRQPGRR